MEELETDPNSSGTRVTSTRGRPCSPHRRDTVRRVGTHGIGQGTQGSWHDDDLGHLHVRLKERHRLFDSCGPVSGVSRMWWDEDVRKVRWKPRVTLQGPDVTSDVHTWTPDPETTSWRDSSIVGEGRSRVGARGPM